MNTEKFILVPLDKFTEIFNEKWSDKDKLDSILYGICNDLKYRTDSKAAAAAPDMYEALIHLKENLSLKYPKDATILKEIQDVLNKANGNR